MIKNLWRKIVKWERENVGNGGQLGHSKVTLAEHFNTPRLQYLEWKRLKAKNEGNTTGYDELTKQIEDEMGFGEKPTAQPTGQPSGGAGGGAGGGGGIDYSPMTEAMRETQRRAAEDREKALGEIRGSKEEISGSPEYTGWAGLVQKLRDQPEAISPEIESQMFEQGRVPIEAGTQSMMRNIQRRYYSRGMMGGQMLGSMQQAEMGKIGQLAGLQRDIGFEKVSRRRQDVLDAISAAGGLAEYKGGVTERTGRNLADIYSNVITAIPDYEKMFAPQTAAPGTSAGAPTETSAPSLQIFGGPVGNKDLTKSPYRPFMPLTPPKRPSSSHIIR